MKKLAEILITPNMKEFEINRVIRRKLTEMGYKCRWYGMWREGGGMTYDNGAEVRHSKIILSHKSQKKSKVIQCYADIVATKRDSVYVIEIKKEDVSKYSHSPIHIMQGIGQLLKYCYEIAKAMPSKVLRGVFIYCGSVSEDENDIVKATIKRFNLPIELVVLEWKE